MTNQIESDIKGTWENENGTAEPIVEVGMEPSHNIVISNQFTRVLKVRFPPGETTFAHRHDEDSLYFFLIEGGIDIVNMVQGSNPKCDCVEFGEVRFGDHKSSGIPLVHKIKNTSDTKFMFCIDAEILTSPRISSPLPLVCEYHKLIKVRDSCRVYKLTLPVGASVSVTYPFFYLRLVLKKGMVKVELRSSAKISIGMKWDESLDCGDVEWKGPCIDTQYFNAGDDVYEAYIVEWR